MKNSLLMIDTILVSATLVLFLVFLVQVLPNILSPEYRYGSFGTHDFIEYWSSYRLFIANMDPYDPIAMLNIQKELDPTRTEPLMMWNPPWTLTLMSFILRYDFPTAARIWLAVNLLLLLLSGLLIWSAISGEKETLTSSLCGTFFFFPAWLTLEHGQLSILLMFGVTLLLWSLQKQRFIWGGLGLSLLTLKPHLTYLVLVVLIYWMVRQKNCKLLFSFFAVLAGMISLTYLHSPHAVYFWMDNSSRLSPNKIYTSPLSWQVATLVGEARYLLTDSSGKFPLLPMVLIPAVSAILLFSYLVIRHPKLHWPTLFPWLLCVSYLTSPYGWTFDQSILVVTQVSSLCLIIEAGIERNSKAILGFITIGLFFLQVASVVLRSCCLTQHHDFWWYPLVLLSLWGLIYRETSPQHQGN